MAKYRIFDRFILNVSAVSIFASLRVSSEDEVVTATKRTQGQPLQAASRFSVEFLYTIGANEAVQLTTFKINWERLVGEAFVATMGASAPSGSFTPIFPQKENVEATEVQTGQFDGVAPQLAEGVESQRFRGEIYMRQEIADESRPAGNLPDGVKLVV